MPSFLNRDGSLTFSLQSRTTCLERYSGFDVFKDLFVCLGCTCITHPITVLVR